MRAFSVGAAVVVVAFVGAGSARAQRPACPPLTPCGELPTVGVAVPVPAVAGGNEPTAVEVNPAELGFLPAWGLMYIHTELDGQGLRGGRGDALYAATPIPYLDQLSVGAAVQSIRPPDLFPYRDEGKLSLSVAWRPLRTLALGATWAHVFTGGTVGVSGIDTLDLGITSRLGPWFAVALVVHDLPSPEFQGLGIERVYEPEVAVRPLGDDRWDMGISARFGERRGDISPRFRLGFTPTPGLIVRGDLQLYRDQLGDVLANDLRATVGVELDFARIGVGGYALFGGNLGGSYLHGGSVTARFSGDRYPSLYTPRRLERIDLGSGGDRAQTALLQHLRKIEKDPRVDGIVLVVGDFDGSWSTAEELRGALERLRAARKHVFVYGAEIDTKAYYVASAAERLYLDPAGGLRLTGMSSTAMYFKGTLDRLGVQADFLKIAEYKSAPEQYTRTGPSPEAAKVRGSLYDDIYGRLVDRLAASRGVSAVKMRALIDAGPYTAVEAKRAGLVDALTHGDEVEDDIGEKLGHHVEAVAVDTRTRRPRSWELPQIAVLYVDGDIIDGKSQYIPILDRRLVGHKTLIEAIANARSDPRVKAIVLRVDSPGGSALASDLIAREIARTRKVKPVVCSFGDVAASGGYFIAAACDPIFASPSTITGSIGIFTGKFDLTGLANKLGVSVDTTRRGAHADIESWWRPYSDEERRVLLEKLRYYYDRFVDTVAEGRKLTHAEVDRVARGRVWTGAQAQAKEIGLVDKLGGFMDAVVEAKRRAGLGEWEPVELEALPDEPTTLLGQLLALLGIRVEGEVSALKIVPGIVELLRALPASVMAAPSTPQARMEPGSDER